MRVHPLDPNHPSALRDTLVRHGLDPARARAVVSGSRRVGLFVTELQTVERDALLAAARRPELECVSGDTWVLLLGPLAALAGLIRPGSSPLRPETAASLGTALQGMIDPPAAWRIAGRSVSCEHPIVVGILNITPDSFSDGGRYLDPDQAARRAVELVAEGADILDVGAESTRPGRTDAISDGEEWDRLGPALAAIRSAVSDVPISVDTYRAVTARRALEGGASIINDVSGFRFDEALPAVCAEAGAGVILMHSRGPLDELAGYRHTDYTDLGLEVAAELETAVDRALAAGIDREAIVVDPGLGFGKRPDQNLEILSRLSDFATLGFPVMVGPSRKRFVRALAAGSDPDALDEATGTVCAAAWMSGARLFRVHRADVARRALRIAAAIREA